MGLVQQFRRPSGVMGRVAGTMMAVINTPLVTMVTTAVAATDGERILDIGFGPGVSLVLLARAAPAAMVAGIDPSPVMVAMARRRTAGLAGQPGRGGVRLGRRQLPEDGVFRGELLRRPAEPGLTGRVARVQVLAVQRLEHAPVDHLPGGEPEGG